MAVDVIVALDVGTVRIGVALARSDVRIASPLTTLDNTSEIYSTVANLLAEQQATKLVVGWPRGLDGQQTAQTDLVEEFVDGLKSHVAVPIYMQDEALTSRKAEAELQARKKPFAKAEVDALAAAFILEDYLATEQVAGNV
jgi:putative holliday junction resolvase